MTEEPAIPRLMKFLRSVVPADPWPLVFLAGTILLFVSPRLGWWPKSILPLAVIPDQRTKFLAFLPFFLWLIIFASLVAYYLCFWSKPKPIGRIVWLVLLPTVLGLGLILTQYFWLSYPERSVLESRTSAALVYEWFGSNLWRFPTGIHVCALGLLLISLFAVRLHLGLSSLPISLRGNADDFAKQYDWLTFVLVGPYFLIAGLMGLLLSLPYLFGRLLWVNFLLHEFSLMGALESFLVIGIVFLILGHVGVVTARKVLRWPELGSVFSGLLLPVAIGLLCSFLPYVIDRIRWATYDFGKMEPPRFLTYFDVSDAWNPWLLLLVFGAFAEEIIFRGLLLTHFMRRFGMGRGIFFTGVVWAALHFRSDSYSGASAIGVLYHLLWRTVLCLAMNYVFSWMTLRWKSVIPSTAAHAVWNILVVAGVHEHLDWSTEVSVILWASLALILFHFWPPGAEQELAVDAASPDSVGVT